MVIVIFASSFQHKKMANAEQEDIGTLEVEKDGHFNADDSKFTGI